MSLFNALLPTIREELLGCISKQGLDARRWRRLLRQYGLKRVDDALLTQAYAAKCQEEINPPHVLPDARWN